MKTISFRLSSRVHAKLDRAAKHGKRTKSDVVREALDRFLNGKPSVKSRRTVSALELAGDLVGCVAGPGDLSTNPKYLA
ncbi:MAG: ribbon-helix-helix protein, CopG family [Planctomycetales bacterium]